MGKATHQQCSNNLLLDHSARIHAYHSRFVRVSEQVTGHWHSNLLRKCVRGFSPFGQTNYARWTPVFLKDMERLPQIHPTVHDAFMEGKFVVQRGDKKFSMMALDQSHEHSINFLKEDSGAKGLYGQQREKEVIELSKPEVLRVITELGVFSILCRTQRTCFNIQNHQLLNRTSSSNTSKLCATLSVKVK